MLDAIRRDRPVNIKDLALDRPQAHAEARLPFDPKRDISTANWIAMHSHYIEGVISYSSHRRQTTVLTGQYLNLLFPDTKKDLRVDDLWEESKITAQGCFQEYRQAINYFPKYAGMKHFFPNQFSELPFPDKLIEGVKRIGLSSNINVRALSTTGFYRRLSYLFGLGILDYKDTVDNAFPQLEPPTQKEVEKLLNPSDKDWPEPYAVLGLRSFYPDLFKQAQPLINWDSYFRDFQGYSRHGEWADVIGLATSMKVMAAEEVRIDETGLVINLRKPVAFSTPDQRLPERRRF